MSGCYKKYSRIECESTEAARIAMNLDQPQHQHNYTEVGFKKITVPKPAWDLISSFWEDNKDKKVEESWPSGYTYTNHWDSPTFMVSPEDSRLRGYGDGLKRSIWSALRPTMEEWVGHKLQETSLYGIRVYTEGAILATHVDRLPLVTSAIIQVDQDVDEPWPAEVYDHSGRAHNFTMRPGEMVLYESHTVLHGRPFPLKGKFYANLFIHYIPVDHDEMNVKDDEEQHNVMAKKRALGNHPYRASSGERKVSGHEQSNHDIEEISQHMNLIQEKEKVMEDGHQDVGADEVGGEDVDEEEDEAVEDDPEMVLHHAAIEGDVENVKALVERDSNLVNKKDKNHWQPLHEAVRAGNHEVVKYLVENGADLDTMTKFGGTPLWWARRSLPDDHAVIRYLEDIGAPEMGEDL